MPLPIQEPTPLSELLPRITDPLRDEFQRPLETLRVSVTDRCNFSCEYCMPLDPRKPKQFFSGSECLTAGEFIRLIKIFAQLGVKKVRFTGGEPLLYPDLEFLLRAARETRTINDLALTTNGALLSQKIKSLQAAGLQRLTVSLDSLDPEIFQKIHGGNFTPDKILNGIRAAENAGFTRIKINTVIKRGINDQNILEIIRRFRGTGHIVRFIEFMDTGNCNHWRDDLVVPSREIIATISRQYPLAPIDRQELSATAQNYRFVDGKGEVGFIAAISAPFCRHCNRLRLASNGQIYTCLFSDRGVDLRAPLRAGATDQEIAAIIRQTWRSREDKYSENRTLFRALADKKQKLEMFKIGG